MFDLYVVDMKSIVKRYEIWVIFSYGIFELDNISAAEFELSSKSNPSDIYSKKKKYIYIYINV